jgi:carbamate kinase
VPSPKPIEVLNASLVKRLAEDGVIVIAAGGGGIPVAYKADKTLEPIEAVIDKDSANSVLAREIGAEEFYILTDVPNVYINFRQPDEKKLEQVTAAELADYSVKGMFGEGNMAPKIQAAVDFVQAGGKVSVITDANSLGTNGGTRISK